MMISMQKNTCRAVLAAYLLIFLLPSLSADGQERPHRRSWEFGLGGSVSNLTRTTLTGFRQTQGGDYVFDLEDRHLYGGLDLYAATALRKWFWLDVQGSLGKVRYYESGGRRSGGSLLLEPGIQIRPVVSSAWIQPYVRAGIGYFGKDFPLRYFGTFEGDVTGEALWRAEDAWNKGYTFDHDHSFPLSAGVGFIGWFGNRVGMRLQGEYLHSLNASGVNFARISAGLVLGLGGPDRRKAEADRYVSRHPSAYDGFYAGRLPEKVVEKEIDPEDHKRLIDGFIDNIWDGDE